MAPLLAEEYYYEFGEKVYLTEDTAPRTSKNSTGRQFQTKQGHRMSATGEIILKVHSFEQLSYFLEKYPIESYQKLDSKTYLLKPTRESDLFALANRMHLDSMSNYAHPNFIREKRGNR